MCKNFTQICQQILPHQWSQWLLLCDCGVSCENMYNLQGFLCYVLPSPSFSHQQYALHGNNHSNLANYASTHQCASELPKVVHKMTKHDARSNNTFLEMEQKEQKNEFKMKDLQISHQQNISNKGNVLLYIMKRSLIPSRTMK